MSATSRAYTQAQINDAQRIDEEELRADMLSTLDAALHRPLTNDEAMLLAWGSGVATDFYKGRMK